LPFNLSFLFFIFNFYYSFCFAGIFKRSMTSRVIASPFPLVIASEAWQSLGLTLTCIGNYDTNNEW